MNVHVHQVIQSLLRFVELRSLARRGLALGDLPLARRRPAEAVTGCRDGEPADHAASADAKPRGCCHV